MKKWLSLMTVVLSVSMSLSLVACGDDDMTVDEADADTSAPDADPAAPDADPNAPDAAPKPDAGPVSYMNDVKPLLANNCSCHVGGAGGLVFGAGAASAYTNLVGVDTMNPDPDCANLMRVDKTNTDPNKSSLYLKLSGGTCGSQMPSGGAKFGADKLAIISAWIMAGAPNN